MKFRWAVITLSILLSLFLLFRPSEDGGSWSLSNFGENIRLGLDLKGGIFMQLEVDEEDAIKQYLEEQAGTIKASLESDEITVESSTADYDRKVVTLTNVASSTDLNISKEIKTRYGNNWFIEAKDAGGYELRLKEVASSYVKNDAVKQAVYKIQNRIDALGVTEPNITQVLGSNRIILELAGADDSSRVHNIVKEPGKLEWRLVQPGTNVAETEQALAMAAGGTIPPGTRVFPFAGDGAEASGFMLLQEVLLTASNVVNVFETRDQSGFPAVGINLDRAGGLLFEEVTGKNVGNHLAIVLDGKVISAPEINGKLGSSFIIQGRFSQNEVANMVVKIKSGSLPAKVHILEERVIGPTLGRDSIRQGFFAGSIGLALVVVFILLYYKRAGVYAFMALVMNLIIILGIIAALGAVLTLPGIAGFILTIGMAVDANVLVFERIREELRDGTVPKNAVEIGYKSAFVTIMDANITTFIAAFCLLLMGQGPIKGFAVMLMIGIVSSIFTAVFCSRTFFLAYMNKHLTLRKLAIWPIWQGDNAQTGTN